MNLKDEFVFDGKTLSYHFTPLNINGIKFIPIQALSSIMNVIMLTDASKKIISIKNGSINFSVQIGSTKAFIDSIDYELAAPVLSLKNIVYIPLDFAVGATSEAIFWNLDENIALLEPGHSLIEYSDSISNVSFSSINTPKNLSSKELSNHLFLVNKWNPVISNYTPNNLENVLDKKNKLIVPSKQNNIKINNKALDALVAMFKAAGEAGFKDIVVSNGYRSFSLQANYYINKVNFFDKGLNLRDAQVRAATIVAPPGMSEHHTGLAIDITTRSLLKTTDPLSPVFGNTIQGKWINANSYKFGYIVRYQPDKIKYTGIVSEPWHLRYVGLPHSEIMKKNNLCLEEYLEYIKNVKYIKYEAADTKTYEIFYFNLFPPVENLKLSNSGKPFCDVSRYGKSGYIITKEMS